MLHCHKIHIVDHAIVIHILYDASNNPEGISPDENQKWYSRYVDILKHLHSAFNSDDPSAATPFAEWQDRVGFMNMTFFINRIIYKDVQSNSPYPDYDDYELPDAQLIQNAETGDVSVDPAHHLDFWFIWEENEESDFVAYAFYPWAQFRLGEGYLGAIFSMRFVTGEWYDPPVFAHEIGHWIGLEHIWGSDDPPSCVDDDEIDDTPNANATYLGECPSDLSSNTCGAGEVGDEPDMFDNMMSYAICLRFFTQGQVERSRTTGTDESPIGILPSFFEYKDPSIQTEFEFLSFFYFVNIDEECFFRDVRNEFNLSVTLCKSYSRNPYVDVYTALELVVGDETPCSDGFQKMDTGILVYVDYWTTEFLYFCYKKEEQTESTLDSTFIDLHIHWYNNSIVVDWTVLGSHENAANDYGQKYFIQRGVNEFDGVVDNVYFVTVEHARDLEDKDTDFLWVASYNDVYVQIFGYGDEDEKVLQTDTINEATEPEWNDQIFEFDEARDRVGVYRSFKFRIYDDDTALGQDLFGDDFLGETDVFLVSEIEECDMDYSMEMTVYRDDNECGTLFVTISKEC